jgi:signal transduction histidine kinase
VAHDLRAPLAAISGFSQALEHELAAGPGTSARSRHFLDRMRVGLQQTHEMIDAMLSLSQLSRAELRCEEVDLAAMARTAFDNLNAHGDRDARLHLTQPLPARGDPRLLQLVLDNLVGNAWKFSGNSTHTEITVGRETGQDGDTVFFVRDNGVGFDMEYAGKLFGAFQRLHSQTEFPGTGVGLANVWRIVTRHGGRVWARSTPGEGATFYFTLGELPPS